jgi:hypothetical protein
MMRDDANVIVVTGAAPVCRAYSGMYVAKAHKRKIFLQTPKGRFETTHGTSTVKTDDTLKLMP